MNYGALQNAKSSAPPYGSRRGFIPRSENDYGDGGAFPEIHVAQYPLEMGAPQTAGKKSNALALQTDQNGKIKYDIIARQGHAKDKIVYSNINQLLPAEVLAEDAEELQRPSEEEIQDITETTRRALEKLTNQKIAAAMPVRAAEKAGPAQYIRYTPAQQGNGQFNSGAKQRVIRMVEAQTDPMVMITKFSIFDKIISTFLITGAAKVQDQQKNTPRTSITTRSGTSFTITQSFRQRTEGMEGSSMHFKLEKRKRLHNSTGQTLGS